MSKLGKLVLLTVFMAVLPCDASQWLQYEKYAYIDDASISKIKNKNNFTVYFYQKRIDKDAGNYYKIPFYGDKTDPLNPRTKTIVYGAKMNCDKRTLSLLYVNLHDYNGKVIKSINTKKRINRYTIPVKRETVSDIEYKIICDYRRRGFFRNYDEQ